MRKPEEKNLAFCIKMGMENCAKGRKTAFSCKNIVKFLKEAIMQIKESAYIKTSREAGNMEKHDV